MKGVRAFLFDVDGTVFQDGVAIPGVVERIAELSRRGVPFAFATNTTSRPCRARAEARRHGIATAPDRILNSAAVARDYLLSEGLERCDLLVTDTLREDLSGIEADDEHPLAVVVGDIETGLPSFAFPA